MKKSIPAVIGLIVIVLFVTACGSETTTAGASESDHTHMDEHEHVDDHHDEDNGHTHDPGQSMAAMHNVPEEAAAVPNPVAATEGSIAIGGALFAANCVPCHGEGGLGDGPTAASLESKPANLTENHVQELSDGALFYIITNGKPETPMPAWEDVLEEEQRWQVVNFLRTLPE